MEAEQPLVSILGFGSLLSRASAQRTFKQVHLFRRCRVAGYCRKFNLVSVSLIVRGIVKADGLDLASCCLTRRAGCELLGVVFEVSAAELPAFHEREHSYDIAEVAYVDEHGAEGMALACLEYNDDDYFRVKCNSDFAFYHQRVGQHYAGKLWREDILPCRRYVDHCLASAMLLDPSIADNFLQQSVLADGHRTLLAHLLPDLSDRVWVAVIGHVCDRRDRQALACTCRRLWRLVGQL